MRLPGLKSVVFLLVSMVGSMGGPREASAHTTGESYVWLNVEEDRFTGRVEINLDDMREKLGMPVPEAESGQSETDPRLEWLTENRESVCSYIRQHFQIMIGDQLVDVDFDGVDIRDLNEQEGNYAMFNYTTGSLEVPDQITLTNTLCLEGDAFHRSLVCIERNQKSGQEFSPEFVAMVFGAQNPTQELDLTNIEGLLRPRDFVWQGVLHIWKGTDHVLFIIALLLPAVLVRDEGTWKPVSSFYEALVNVLKIVTIFTVAHSITLSLAALGIVNLGARLVESVIALSIILVAINTIRPQFDDKKWLVIFGFGLFHGMGFASVMSDLPFRMLNLVKVLIAFNVGVELGQIAIVVVVFPVIFFLCKKVFYRPVILVGGSLAIAAMACVWFAERAFGAG